MSTLKPGPLCHLCPLNDKPGPIFGQGSPHAKLAVFGQNPGPSEITVGFPFAGSSGKILNRGMFEVGINRDKDCYVSNVVKCFLAPGAPLPLKAIQCCKPLLEQELNFLDNLNVKVTLGLEPFNAMTGKDLHLQHARKAAEKNPRYWVRGYPFRAYTTSRVPIIPLEHPSSIMRKGFLSIPLWQADWRKVKRWFDGNGKIFVENNIDNPTDAEVNDYVDFIIERKEFGVDIETPESSIDEEELVARAATPIDVIGLSAKIGECIGVQPNQFPLLDRLFEKPYGLQGSAFNWGFDGFHMSQRWNLKHVKWFDLMLALNLLYSDLRPKDLGMCLSIFTDMLYHKNLRKTSPSIYNCRDTYGAYWGMLEAEQALRENGLEEVFWNHDTPCIEIVEDMRNIGVNCDVTYAQKAELTCYKQLETYENWWHKNMPLYNWASPKDLQALFVKMKMPIRMAQRVKQKTKEKYTSQTLDNEVLEEYRDAFGNKTAGLVLEMRRLKKAADFTHIYSKDGRSHSQYKIHGQKQGRIQSKDPDLQNIPEEAAGINPRKIAVGDDPQNDVVIVADFSQIELRIYAQLAHDTPFLLAFKNDEYIYGQIFEDIFNRAFFKEGCPRTKEFKLPSVKPQELLIAKSCPLGFIYGRGGGSMVNLGVTKQKGFEIFNKLDKEHHAISEFHRRILFQAQRDGYLRNPFGRIRRFPNAQGQRNEILSFPGQNTAADVLRIRALIPLQRGLSKFKARLLFTVHDSTGINCPKAALTDCVPFIKQTMEEPIPQLEELSIPVEIKVGPNWDEGILYENYCKGRGITI